MGCDINVFVEIRRNKRWEKVGNLFAHPIPELLQPRFECTHYYSDSPYILRNYELFSILADVRDFGDGTPIATPRGIPSDLSHDLLSKYALTVAVLAGEDNGKSSCTLEQALSYVRTGSSIWIEPYKLISGPDWHTPSWLTLRELLIHDWHTTEVTYSGWVNSIWYGSYKRLGKPGIFCKYIGRGVEVISNHEMERRIADQTATENCQTLVRWVQTNAQSAGVFLTETIPSIARMMTGEHHEGAAQLVHAILQSDKVALDALHDWLEERGFPNLDDVRIVFWFDG